MKRAGFTLLEMMVATVIMGVAVVALLSGISTAMRNADRLTDYDRAVQLARTRMDELLADRRAPAGSTLDGVFPPSLMGRGEGGWRAHIAHFELPPQASPGTPLLDRVELEVWWTSGGRRRTFALEGYRPGFMTQEEAAGLATAAQ
jgi:prepilin-type N-terminal cleavage/methylation domain-containing protein